MKQHKYKLTAIMVLRANAVKWDMLFNIPKKMATCNIDPIKCINNHSENGVSRSTRPSDILFTKQGGKKPFFAEPSCNNSPNENGLNKNRYRKEQKEYPIKIIID